MPRLRALGLTIGTLPTGPSNSLTDVPGVRVGHVTLQEGRHLNTGVTAILPHGGNLYQERVPANVAVGNGYGKLAGITQLQELGELETPIVLTNTLSVAAGLEGLIRWTLTQPGNEAVQSVNGVVGETNDGVLNDIRACAVTPEHVRQALAQASTAPVAEGVVGAGTGTVAFGFKGGIGSSSRQLPGADGGYTVGVLVQSNFGGRLTVAGHAVDLDPQDFVPQGQNAAQPVPDGSIMLVVATDAPLSDRNLRRLASRALLGIARTGGWMANGSGDYAIAFSTAPEVRRPRSDEPLRLSEWPNERMSPLFQAAAEASEEAILNSLFMAHTVAGYSRTVPGLPLERVLAVLGRA